MNKVTIMRKACEDVLVNGITIPKSKVLEIKTNNDHTVNVVIEVKVDKIFFSHSKEFSDAIE